MKIPPGLVPPLPNHVCIIKRCLYGLEQASQQWYSRLAVALSYKGYTSSLHDYSLFFKKSAGLISIIAIYMDEFF